jgi:quinoprotein glucose dehydrogenase
VPKGELIREQTPVVIDGVMYVNSGSKVHAIDAATGTPVWSFDIEPPLAAPFLGKRGPSYADGRIYAFSSTDIFAVDAKTGKLVESFGDGGVLHIIQKALQFKYPGEYPANVDVFQMGYNVGATPKYYNGLFYIGIGGSDSLIPGGFLIAADAKTGAITWVFNTIPQSASDDGWAFTKDTWPANGRRVGGGIWYQPAIDPMLGIYLFPGDQSRTGLRRFRSHRHEPVHELANRARSGDRQTPLVFPDPSSRSVGQGFQRGSDAVRRDGEWPHGQGRGLDW